MVEISYEYYGAYFIEKSHKIYNEKAAKLSLEKMYGTITKLLDIKDHSIQFEWY